jgi:hypothetical protein
VKVGDGEGVEAKRVERRVVWKRMDSEMTEEPEEEEEIITCWFNPKGRLLRVSWASEPNITLGLPFLQVHLLYYTLWNKFISLNNGVWGSK